MLQKLEEHQSKFGGQKYLWDTKFKNSTKIWDFSTKQGKGIEPIEQRKIIQINENISKMAAKLENRLQRIRHIAHNQPKPSEKNIQTLGAINTKKSLGFSISSNLANFCAIELDRLNLRIDQIGTEQLNLLDTNDSSEDIQNFQCNLRKYLLVGLYIKQKKIYLFF